MFYLFVFAFSVAAVYITLRLARRFSVYDIQDGRRMHNGLTLSLGCAEERGKYDRQAV